MSSSLFSLSNNTLSISGFTLLTQVPSNLTLSSSSSACKSSQAPLHLFLEAQSQPLNGCFLGFSQTNQAHLLKNPLGHFTSIPFLSIFRFKIWMSSMWVGSKASEIQPETQWVLFHLHELNLYAILVPLIEGPFRSALHPGPDDRVWIWAESGSTRVRASGFKAIAYVHVGDNPFNVMNEAFASVRVHLDTCRLLEEKTVPPVVERFGWCTWDAFYLSVEPKGIWYGVKEFYDNGLRVRFLVIDDGWQSIEFDDGSEEKLILGGQQMLGRLCRFEECEKFRKYRAGSLLDPNPPEFDPIRLKNVISKALEKEDLEKEHDKAIKAKDKLGLDLASVKARVEGLKIELDQMYTEEEDDEFKIIEENDKQCACKFGLRAFTKDLRTKFPDLEDIYVWQALCGAWGGVKPKATGFNSEVVDAKLSEGLYGTMDDLAANKMVESGIGLVSPNQAEEFYDAMHSYLSESGLTGVKVDDMHTLECICEEYGGRVELAKTYYKGLSKSLVKNFNNTGLVCSMQQCNDFFFLGTQQISFGRVGDDFWFHDPNGDPTGAYWLQGVHMIHCAYNSLWICQFIHPDWDMFRSDHCCAKFHAGSRSICGGPIYVSDAVGFHDFDLIKKLVFPDGTIPKCIYFALPTGDCLFKSPLFDGESVLKIWNLNKFGGVVGVFNCQGAGWDPKVRKFRGYPQFYKPVSDSVHPNNIEWDQKKETSHMGEAEEYAVHLNQANKLFLTTPKSSPTQITIQPSSFEIFSFIPIKNISHRNLKFAPVGLVNMFNSGGTIVEVEHDGDSARVRVKGKRSFLAYSSGRPLRGMVDGDDVGFDWSDDGSLEMEVDWEEDKGGMSEVCFVY